MTAYLWYCFVFFGLLSLVCLMDKPKTQREKHVNFIVTVFYLIGTVGAARFLFIGD